MLFRKELKSYLAILKIKSTAFLTVAFCIEDLFLLLNKYLFKNKKRSSIQKATVKKALDLILRTAK